MCCLVYAVSTSVPGGPRGPAFVQRSPILITFGVKVQVFNCCISLEIAAVRMRMFYGLDNVFNRQNQTVGLKRCFSC